MSQFDLFFWKNLVSNGLATLLGAVIGIPIALVIDRHLAARRKAEERQQAHTLTLERKLQLIESLEAALRKNQQLVQQMKTELTPQSVIFYNVDTLLLDSTSSIKYQLIEDLRLDQLLDSIRYELAHLHRKVDLQVEIEFSAFKAMQRYQVRRSQLISAIRDHFPRIESEIGEALNGLALMKTQLTGKFQGRNP